MKSKEKLIQIIRRQIIPIYQEPLIAEIKASIQLKTVIGKPQSPESTKLGGLPYWPENQAWPRSQYDNRPMSFLGQINLTDFNNFEPASELPKSGIFYFFFDLDSADVGKAIFVNGANNLHYPSTPEELIPKEVSFFKRLFGRKQHNRVLPEFNVEMSLDYNIPSWDSFRLERIQKQLKTEIKPIDAFKEDFFEKEEEGIYWDEFTPDHHVLGNYHAIQGGYIEPIDNWDSNALPIEKLSLGDI